jgi:hypothetical protein
MKNRFLLLLCAVVFTLWFRFWLGFEPGSLALFLPKPPLFTVFRFSTDFVFQQRVKPFGSCTHFWAARCSSSLRFSGLELWDFALFASDSLFPLECLCCSLPSLVLARPPFFQFDPVAATRSDRSAVFLGFVGICLGFWIPCILSPWFLPPVSAEFSRAGSQFEVNFFCHLFWPALIRYRADAAAVISLRFLLSVLVLAPCFRSPADFLPARKFPSFAARSRFWSEFSFSVLVIFPASRFLRAASFLVPTLLARGFSRPKLLASVSLWFEGLLAVETILYFSSLISAGNNGRGWFCSQYSQCLDCRDLVFLLGGFACLNWGSSFVNFVLLSLAVEPGRLELLHSVSNHQ